MCCVSSVAGGDDCKSVVVFVVVVAAAAAAAAVTVTVTVVLLILPISTMMLYWRCRFSSLCGLSGLCLF